MKNLVTVFTLLITTHCFAQWTTLDIPAAGRYDDVFFINDSTGWAAGGSSGIIRKTTDGGNTWVFQKSTGKYLRSIEFATPLLGFCGSLDSCFYRTTDGGLSWTDISGSINPKPPGICGLAAPAPNVIYGCGIWSSPAYLIKSSNGGNTWTSTDLSAYASALVDIHFVNKDTGFVSGKAQPATDGGVILKTTDGGISWSVIHRTMVAYDYVWKLQTPDGINFYGAVDGSSVTNNTRMLHSPDRGNTWNSILIRDSFFYIQAIGFINEKKGWTGGRSVLFETEDGGLTWKNIKAGTAYNRFFRMNDHKAFLSGDKIYKYEDSLHTGIMEEQAYDELHTLGAWPNPAGNEISVEVNTANATYAQLKLFSATGKLLQVLYDQRIEKGVKKFSIPLADYPPQAFFLVLHTNEGVQHIRVIKQ